MRSIASWRWFPGARVEGEVLFHGINLYDRDIEPAAVRRTIGMVFQQPNPFPTMSIYGDVAAAARFNRMVKSRQQTDELVESCLQRAALWDKVKDPLASPALRSRAVSSSACASPSALAVNPEVMLMEEPCSALDPIATLQIELYTGAVTQQYAIVVVLAPTSPAGSWVLGTGRSSAA